MIPGASYENWYAQTGRIYGFKATGKAKPGSGPHRNREQRQGPCTSSPSQGAVISWDFTTGAAIKRKNTKDPVRRPLSCPCVAIAALSPITVLRLNVGQVVLHLRGRSAGTVWGDLALRRFNDWRASAGARSGALPSCGAHSRQSVTPRARVDGKKQEPVPVHQAPHAPRDRHVGGFGRKTVDSGS
jgi:hypothetical protein